MMKHSQPTPTGTGIPAGFIWPRRILSPLNLLLFLGTSIQLGLHFWPASSLIYGIRVDYLSPTLYALDFGILLSLCLSYILKAQSSKLKAFSPLLLLALSNLLFPLLPLQSLIWWARLIIYSLWAKSLSPDWLRQYLRPTLFWLCFLTLLGVAQIFLGHSLQGIFYWLGERRLSLGQPGIALQELFGVKYLRSYSLFSHPNIFAGWTVMVIYLLTTTNLSRQLKYFAYLTGLVIITLTASRAAGLSLALLAWGQWLKGIPDCKSSRASWRQEGLIPMLFGSIMTISLLVYLVLVRPESVVIPRLALIGSSIHVFLFSPIFGTGALGSLLAAHLLQPDHFVPTLLLSWFGLVGIAQLFCISLSLKAQSSKLKSLLPLLPLLFLDHYLLTSLSGLSIFIIILRFLPYLHFQKLKAIT